MLRTMTYQQFCEWEEYWTLNPFGPLRDDIRTANLMQLIANMMRDPKQRAAPYELKDFLLEFGKDSKPKQSQKYIERVLDDWVFMNNALQGQKVVTVKR